MGICWHWHVASIISSQKICGLYALKHHIVEMRGGVTDAGQTTNNNWRWSYSANGSWRLSFAIYINLKKVIFKFKNLHRSSIHKVNPQRANLYLQRSSVNPQRSKCPVWWDAENNHSQVQWSNAPRISQSWVSSTHIYKYLYVSIEMMKWDFLSF